MFVVAAIAGHVLRDAVRGRALRGVALAALGMAAAAPLAGRLSAGQDLKVIKDLGLAAIELAGLVLAVSMGLRQVAREVERRTVDAVLSKPVRRHEFILGHYAGLVATLALALGLLTAVLYGVLAAAAGRVADGGFSPASAPAVDPALLTAVFLVLAQLAVVAAAALCFSTAASPPVAAAATGGFYVAGHFGAELRRLGEVVDAPLAATLAAGLSRVLPDLASFDVKAAVVHGLPVGAGHVALTAASAAAYVAALLVLAAAAFSRRDLT